jgi:hypothetical protein
LSPRKNREQLAENTGKLPHERGSVRWLIDVFTPPICLPLAPRSIFLLAQRD